MSSEFLTAALDAAQAAAEVIRKAYRGNFEVSYKADASPVTEVDVGAEKAIKAVLQERFPAHGFYGEETGREQADGPDVHAGFRHPCLQRLPGQRKRQSG